MGDFPRPKELKRKLALQEGFPLFLAIPAVLCDAAEVLSQWDSSEKDYTK